MNGTQFRIKTRRLTTWGFIFIASCFIRASESDPRITESGLFCGNATARQGIDVVLEFNQNAAGLRQVIANSLFGTFGLNGTNPFYTLFQCHGDLTQTDCLLCFAPGITRLPQCVPAVGGALFLDGCFFRYDNYSFYQESVSSRHSRYDAVKCSADDVEGRVDFRVAVGFAVGNASQIAVRSNGYGVYDFGGVYVLAQCWETVPRDGCQRCLASAAAAVNSCVPKKEGRGMNAGCYLRYSTEKFYNNRTGNAANSGSSRKQVILASVLAGVAFLVLSAAAAYATYARMTKTRRERDNLGRIPTRFITSGLAFKYETLEKATDFFSPERKLGEGGNGSVFLGTLRNQTTVAVKRLIFNTKQWVDDFFNEVNLISRIHHKNLVQLLGCSIEGPESLLVYEYVPNKSLDLFLFDNEGREVLNWRQRMNIILGTAEGLAYLHGGSEVRIIHRDIKSSNVLLDRDMNAKIADFGLARCLGADRSHLTTGLAGTLGYMAPEYLVRGQLTEKADVYSFGVVVLEIACGRRNSAFAKDAGSLLQTVWRHYKMKSLAEAVDPTLKGDSDLSAKEVAMVLQIGLLCTQATASLRPSMEQVVRMLTGDDCRIPEPKQPPFMNSSMLNPTSLSGSGGSNNSLINAARRFIDGSSTFDTNSTISAGDSRSDEEVAILKQ